MNHHVLTAVLAMITTGLVVWFTNGNDLAVQEIMLLKLIYVTTLLVSIFTIIHFLRGTKYDVYHEVFDERNTAAAMAVGAIIIAVALVIAK